MPEWPLPRCPEEFYKSCSRAPFSCDRCSAGHGRPGGAVLFKDKNNALTVRHHPHHIQLLIDKETNKAARVVDKTKSRQVKAGYANEKQLLKATVRSGAAYQDGDLTALDNSIRIDSKRRHNTESFTVSAAEYKKGKTQGITTWMITVGPDANTTTMVCMELETYQLILTLAQERLDSLSELKDEGTTSSESASTI